MHERPEHSQSELLIDTWDRILASRKFKTWSPPSPAPQSTSVRKTSKRNRPASGKPEYYSVKEISSLWGISTDFVRDVFKNEPGVLKFDRPGTRTKRGYSTIRVPGQVLERVHSRLSARGI